MCVCIVYVYTIYYSIVMVLSIYYKLGTRQQRGVIHIVALHVIVI